MRNIIAIWICTALLPLAARPMSAAWSDDPAVNLAVSRADGHQTTSAASSVSDGEGGAIIVWVQDPYSSVDLWAQRVSADGDILWPGEGVVVTDAAGTQNRIRVISDGAGGAIVVWRDRRGSDYDYWAQRIDADGQVLWPVGSPSLDGVPVCTSAGDQESMEAVSDGAGGAIVVWRHSDADDEIRAQRLGPDGSRLWPTGAPSDLGVVVCDHPSGSLNPSATADGAGGAIVVWQDSRNNAVSNIDVYAQRIDSSGTRVWSVDGVSVTQADYGQTVPQATATGTGGAIVIWKDYRVAGAVEGIFAQRLSSSGSTLWAADLELTDGLEGGMGILSDGAGGAYVVWRDRRYIAVTDRDLLAQRLGPDGDKLWGADDLPLVVEDDSQSSFDMLSAGAGGLYVSWTDARNGAVDIYAQHVSQSGVVSGPANGTPICTDADWQGASTISGDGSNGIIVAWYDYRNVAATGTDIYAHRAFAGLIFGDDFEGGDTGAWDFVFP